MKKHFYDMVLTNEAFVAEIETVLQDEMFYIALHNFINVQMFGELAALTPYYINNRQLFDPILEKYNSIS